MDLLRIPHPEHVKHIAAAMKDTEDLMEERVE